MTDGPPVSEVMIGAAGPVSGQETASLHAQAEAALSQGRENICDNAGASIV